MKTMIAALLAAGMMVSGYAQAVAPAPSKQQSPALQPQSPAAHVAGAGKASSASTGHITPAKVVGVSIAAAAVLVMATGASRDGHTSGTTGTH